MLLILEDAPIIAIWASDRAAINLPEASQSSWNHSNQHDNSVNALWNDQEAST